jgi:hypothetical protein
MSTASVETLSYIFVCPAHVIRVGRMNIHPLRPAPLVEPHVPLVLRPLRVIEAEVVRVVGAAALGALVWPVSLNHVKASFIDEALDRLEIVVAPGRCQARCTARLTVGSKAVTL